MKSLEIICPLAQKQPPPRRGCFCLLVGIFFGRVKVERSYINLLANKPKMPKQEKPIGEISHFFSNISVAVIDLFSSLKKGDKIRITGGQETDFEQKVDSMQVDHKEVKSAKKGDSIGMKVKEKVREGYRVFKV